MIRPLSLLAVALIVGAGIAGCDSTPGSTKVNSGIKVAPGYLPVKVTPVTATLEPYNPQLANQGIAAEQVSFDVSSVSGNFSCKIDVLRSGRVVGSTTATMGPPSGGGSSVTESVPVEGIKGGTFAGNSSDAHVTCRSGNLRSTQTTAQTTFPPEAGYRGVETFCAVAPLTGTIHYDGTSGELTGALTASVGGLPPDTAVNVDWSNDHVRVPVIGGFETDSKGNSIQSSVIVSRLGEVRGVEVILTAASVPNSVLGRLEPC